jgi:hypothetical protein
MPRIIVDDVFSSPLEILFRIETDERTVPILHNLVVPNSQQVVESSYPKGGCHV